MNAKLLNACIRLCVCLPGVGPFTGCSSPPPRGAAPSLHLRHQSSTRDHCGPTTLASVLSFHGNEDFPEARISELIFSPTARGVLITDLARIGREAGFESRITYSTMEDLHQAVDQRLPPIVLLDLGIGSHRVPHFTAVTGITETGVFVIGTSSTDDFISHRLFKRQWNRTENQLLLLTPSS